MERDVADKVLSDVHVFTPHSVLRKHDSENAVTRFYFSVPVDGKGKATTEGKTTGIVSDKTSSDDVDYDEDGDMVLVRKPNTDNKMVITIEHMMETSLDDVGLQVWQGCLLLCDYVLHLHTKFKDTSVLDLGAGVGLTSIVAGLYAKSVFATDVGETVLRMAERNIALNQPLLKENSRLFVRELDWCQAFDIKDKNSGEDISGYQLSRVDKQLLDNVSIILAAEVIYDPDLTDAFFSTVTHLMSKPPKKSLYITLEKRMVFTVDDLDVVSPAYDHFQEKLEELSTTSVDGVTFSCSQVPCDFPQYFVYDRHKHLELWEVVSCAPD